MTSVYHGKDVDIYRVDNEGSTSQIGYAESFSFDTATNREGKAVLGKRTPNHYKEGPLEITGTLNRYYINNDYSLDMTSTAYLHTPDEYEFQAEIGDATCDTTSPVYNVKLTGVVFTDKSFDVPSDDMVTENMDFEASGITWGSGTL